MRVNLPVTDVEYQLAEDTLILSTTDTKGRITFVNPTFIEVSGFSMEELLGKAHNIVRHPDVPPEAFDDLWKTLKAGLPWTGLVKNRRKNGDYYWVLANATPLLENGKIVGYLSVRTKPARALIDQVAPIYRQFREGTAHNLKIERGGVVRTDFVGRLAALCRMTIGKRNMLFMSVPTLILLAVGVAGWWGQSQAAAIPWLGSFIALATVSGVLLMLLLGHFMTKNTVEPLRKAIDIANTLAAGDLNSKFTMDRSDEFSELFKALAQTGVNLRATVLDVRSGTVVVSQAAGEMVAGNLDLSQRTEEQASSLEETASSMEELTSTVRQNAENAKQANQLAISASDIAVKGGGVVGEVVATMSSIDASSRKIVDIISVIDGIAFQTNILALNAAVEAARAGEQGRGFAVVATEVRNLAQRSAAAAKEIKALISDSVEKVGSGSKLVDEAGKTMAEIVTSIKRVTDIMAEITTASQEQSAGIEQVNEAIAQMDDVTQQNAALVEEAAAASASLEEQALNLTGAISIFKVGSAATAAIPRRSAEVVRLPAARPARKAETKEIAMAPAGRARRALPAKAAAAGGGEDWDEF